MIGPIGFRDGPIEFRDDLNGFRDGPIEFRDDMIGPLGLEIISPVYFGNRNKKRL